MNSLNAGLTLVESAQVFHFQKIEAVYAANVAGRVLTSADTDEFAINYFDLNRDYGALYAQTDLNRNIKRAGEMLPGLRVLNQPAWEAVCAFILSANNNVGRITRCVKLLNETYGQGLDYKGRKLYGFPAPETLARVPEEELRRSVRCGYRAKYLIETAKMVDDGFDLEKIKQMPYEQARKQLMRLPGIGGKVADCVALFGLGFTMAFPVDVWVKRAMESLFHITGTPDSIRKQAVSLLGENAGLYQQALFHAARTGLIEI